MLLSCDEQTNHEQEEVRVSFVVLVELVTLWVSRCPGHYATRFHTQCGGGGGRAYDAYTANERHGQHAWHAHDAGYSDAH